MATSNCGPAPHNCREAYAKSFYPPLLDYLHFVYRPGKTARDRKARKAHAKRTS